MSEEIKMGSGLTLPNPPPDSKYRITEFSDGLVPEKIINRKNIKGTDYFLVKWKDVEEMSYVKASTANKKCPHIIIEFFESRLQWE